MSTPLNPSQFNDEDILQALGGVAVRPHHRTMSNDALDEHLTRDHPGLSTAYGGLSTTFADRAGALKDPQRFAEFHSRLREGLEDEHDSEHRMHAYLNSTGGKPHPHERPHVHR